jgi:hypothetical protein
MPRVPLGPFSIEAPNDWSLTTVILAGPIEENPGAAGMLTTKAVRPFQQNIVVTMEQVEASETAESYVKRQIEGLKKAQVQRRETSAPETVKLKTGSGLLTEQSVSGPGGESVRQLQLVHIKEGVAYTLIATHLDGQPYDRAKARFRAALLSLGF